MDVCVPDAVANSGERTRLAYWRARPAIANFCFRSLVHCVAELKIKPVSARRRIQHARTRAFPRVGEYTRSYWPSFSRNCARAYSRLSFAMKLALILAGHTASHSQVLVQLHNTLFA